MTLQAPPRQPWCYTTKEVTLLGFLVRAEIWKCLLRHGLSGCRPTSPLSGNHSKYYNYELRPRSWLPWAKTAQQRHHDRLHEVYQNATPYRRRVKSDARLSEIHLSHLGDFRSRKEQSLRCQALSTRSLFYQRLTRPPPNLGVERRD